MDALMRVEQMVMEDRRLTVRQIAANAGISVGYVDTILHDDLKMRKPCSIMSSDRLHCMSRSIVDEFRWVSYRASGGIG